MANSTLNRVGSYEGRQSPETYREACLDVRSNGVTQAMDAATEAARDPLRAEQDMLTLEKGAKRLMAVKEQLRKEKFEVSALAETRVAELKAAYADAFAETMRAIDDRTPEGVAAAKRVTLLMRDCQILAERLIGPLGQAVASEARRKATATQAAKKRAQKSDETGEIDLTPKRAPQDGDTGDATQVGVPTGDIDMSIDDPSEPLGGKELDDWIKAALEDDEEAIPPTKPAPALKPAAPVAKPAPSRK